MRRSVLVLLALVPVLTGCASPAGPHREVLAPSPSPLPVFSPAVRTGNLVFLSGQIGNRPGTLELVPGGIGPETEQTLSGIRTLLEELGLSLADVVKCTVFLADIADYQAMNEVYARFFPKDPPARSTLAASGLALGARIEIECIAAMR
ncbi:MAG TPA: RidA family protein [Thermoanaerobaculia bacterium]|nr:RidA family protein [Thermoanaerobaculia bacterium]